MTFNRVVVQQQTIKEPVSMSGIGLHSGNKVTMSFLPADTGSGIVFRRVDLEGKPEIPASLEQIHETNRSTTLAKGNVRIHTVEHVLSTFSGLGVDNVIVELDANEPPIGDGSARAYVQMVEQAGVERQNAERETFVLKEPIQIQLGESVLSAYPHDRLKITCTSADREGKLTQVYTLEVSPETWEKELSEARTFCFFEEIEYLIKNGLIKGGSLENAVVIRDDAVLTTEPLRYPDEFVRHKILDIIGDLALVGKPIGAHIMAVRPGHAANCELGRKIHEQIRRPMDAAQTFAPPPVASQPKVATKSPKPVKKKTQAVVDPESEEPMTTALDVMEVMKLLPHRYPFLMVDKVLHTEGNRIKAVKNVSINEPFFEGHFPQHPIMPGVLQLEAIAQVAGILMLLEVENTGKIAFFMSAESVKWRKPVRPGDRLIIEVELLKTRRNIGKARGVCRVDGDIVSEADVTFMLSDR